MRIRKVEESNYIGVFDGLNTTRYRVDATRPIGRLAHPEVIDVSLGTYCTGGCPYCYASASVKGSLYPNVVEDVHRQFGPLGKDRPFQVAIGGGGEPTLHPEFIDVLQAFRELDIVPNYTTNGVGLTQEIIDATLLYCGGVAVTAHKHLNYADGIERLLDAGVKNVNLHVVVGAKGSAQYASLLRHRWPSIKYVVLLPYQASGFAKSLDQDVYVDELLQCAKLIHSDSSYALGALFDKVMAEYPEHFAGAGISTYAHENFSGYMQLDGSGLLYVSSYKLEERPPS